MGLGTYNNTTLALARDGSVGRKLGAQTPLQFLTDFGDGHSGHYDKFAAQHFSRLIIIGKLAHHSAILTLLVPTEASVGYGLRTNVLKATKERVLLRDLKLLAEDSDLHETLKRPERFRHV
jgi:hypothetical protein